MALDLLQFIPYDSTDERVPDLLTYVSESIPGVQAARLFHVQADQSLAPWHPDQVTEDERPTEENRIAALARATPFTSADGQQTLIPLQKHNEPFAVLVLQHTTDEDLPETVLSDLRNQLTLYLLALQAHEAPSEPTSQTPDNPAIHSMRNAVDTFMRSAAAIRTEAQLLEFAAENLLRATGADHVGIGMLEQETGVTTIRAEAPRRGAVGRTIEESSSGIVSMANQQDVKRPIFIPDVKTSPLLTDDSRQLILSIGAASNLFTPIFDLEDNILGTIGLDWAEAQTEVDPAVIETAQTVATQLGINIEKLRLITETRLQAERMHAISRFGQALQTSLNVRETLETALRELSAILPTDYISVLLYSRSRQHLLRAAAHLDGENRISLPGDPLFDTDTIATHVWETQETLVLRDLKTQWEWKHPRMTDLHTLYAGVMAAGGVKFGVLEVASRDENAFRSSDQAIFEQVCTQLGAAFNNAETYQQSQKQAQVKGLANDIITELQQQTEIEDILTVTARKLGIAIGAKRARIRLGQLPAEIVNGSEDEPE